MANRLDPHETAEELRRLRRLIRPEMVGLEEGVEVTQEAVATALGLGHRTYHRYESGERAPKLLVLREVRRLAAESKRAPKRKKKRARR